VGPKRFFGPGALYRPLIWAFLIGAIAPIILYLITKKSSKPVKAFLQKVNTPLLFGSLSWIPPATGLNFSVWALVCWVFNYRIRRTKSEWWNKYTMTLSAALDSGLAVGVVVVFFGIVWPEWSWMENFKWWGTEVYKQVRLSTMAKFLKVRMQLTRRPGVRLAGLFVQDTQTWRKVWAGKVVMLDIVSP